MAEEITDESLAFLYRAAASRGPGKRPVRVVSREKLIANFQSLGAISDEDDDDFQPDEFSGSEDEEDDDATEDDGGSNDEEISRNERRDSNEPNDEIEGKFQSCRSDSQADGAVSYTTTDQQHKSSSIICCLCLNQRFPDQEVIQCDLCGVCVHEGCYGIAEEDWTAAKNGADSDSEVLTEPWFCEPCLAGLNPRANGNVYCELCPVKGGAYKRTATGRSVHLTCAFYTPKVTFGDVYHLSHVSLADVLATPSRYRRANGAVKPCNFCTDRLAARTGVPVKCDAGLCKQHAHIMCAQRRGLLVYSSASGFGECVFDGTSRSMSTKTGPDPATVADPYYWCCPVHSDRAAVQLKKRLQAKVEANEANFKPRRLSEREREKLAVRRAQFCGVWVQRQRSHLSAATTASVGTNDDCRGVGNDDEDEERPPRLMSTCFEFMNKMRAKTLAATGADDGIDLDGNVSASAARRWLDDFRVDFHPSLVNKFVVPPAFATDFVAYYEARENQLIPALRAQVKRLGDETQRLIAEQEALLNDGELKENQHQYEELLSFNKAYYAKLVRCCDFLKALNCKNIKTPSCVLGHKFSPGCKSLSPKKKLHLNTNDTKPSDQKSGSSQVTPSPIGLHKSALSVSIYECATCGLSSDQHKLAFCDTCQKRYHLACLDPPLTKMPRKTPKFGWECSNCFRGSSDSGTPKGAGGSQPQGFFNAKSMKTTNLNAPRRLRTTHKPVNRLITEKSVEKPSIPQRRGTKRPGRGPGRPRKNFVAEKRDSVTLNFSAKLQAEFLSLRKTAI